MSWCHTKSAQFMRKQRNSGSSCRGGRMRPTSRTTLNCLILALGRCHFHSVVPLLLNFRCGVPTVGSPMKSKNSVAHDHHKGGNRTDAPHFKNQMELSVYGACQGSCKCSWATSVKLSLGHSYFNLVNTQSQKIALVDWLRKVVHHPTAQPNGTAC
jgi:hypothetical protein